MQQLEKKGAEAEAGDWRRARRPERHGEARAAGVGVWRSSSSLFLPLGRLVGPGGSRGREGKAPPSARQAADCYACVSPARCGRQGDARVVLRTLIDENLLSPGGMRADSGDSGAGRRLTDDLWCGALLAAREQEAVRVVLPQARVRRSAAGWVDPLQGRRLHVPRALRAADEAHAQPLCVLAPDKLGAA